MSRVFLFDIDGTLLNSGRAGQAAMEDALRVEFGVTEMDCDISYAGRTDSAIVQDLFAWFELPADPATFERFQQRYFSLLPTHLADRNGKVLPGVTRLLEHLNADSNDWTGLLTGNFERSGWMKVRHFAIDHHFSFGAFGDHHTNRDDVARL
ncbi:MAG: HAD hydrolase-like protein, partial [Planctomycetaceae bacterium]|nr:HAD hydrolase-like protein [Planctomycetaceae bacterium]